MHRHHPVGGSRSPLSSRVEDLTTAASLPRSHSGLPCPSTVSFLSKHANLSLFSLPACLCSDSEGHSPPELDHRHHPNLSRTRE